MPKIPWEQLVSQEYQPQSYQSPLSIVGALAIPTKIPGGTGINITVTTTCTVTNTGNAPITFDIAATHYPLGTPTGSQYTQVPTNKLVNQTLNSGASGNFTLTCANVDFNWVNGNWQTQIAVMQPGTTTPWTGGTATLNPSFTVSSVVGVSITVLTVT